MGLSNFPCLAEGELPALFINTVFSVALLRKLLRSAVQVIIGGGFVEEQEDPYSHGVSQRRVSITKFRPLWGYGGVDCSVCLCRFEEDEDVSELSCNHFFHKSCLQKWFHRKHTTCPLCRSIN